MTSAVVPRDFLPERRCLRWQDYAVLVVLPVGFWLLLDPAMILQRGMVDCWFYTGMATVWEKMNISYGWTYYYLRFPVGFLHRLFLQGADPLVGYLLVRWLIMVTAGGAVYLAVLRIYGRLSAMVTYLFMLNAMLFMRIIVSDYPAYISIPLASAGAGLWLAAGDRRRWLWCLGAGACFGVSANCHIFSSTGFGLFAFGMLAAQVLHKRPWLSVLADIGAVALGFLVLCAVGLLYMRHLFPDFSLVIFWKVTLKALVDGGTYATSHLQPFRSWGARCVYIYIPFLLWAGAFVLRDKTASDYRRTAILLGSALLFLFYSFYRFVLGKFVFEEISYFIHTFILAVFLIPGVIAAAEARLRRPGLLLGLIVLTVVLGTAGAHLSNRGVYPVWNLVWDSFAAVGLILLGGVIGFVAIKRAPPRWIPTATFLFFFSVELLAMPAGFWVFAAPSEVEQVNIYRAGIKYSRYWARFVQPTNPPWIWLKSSADDLDIFSLSFVTQCHSIHYQWQYGRMPQIGEYERIRLVFAAQSHLLILGKGHSEVEEGTNALILAGYEVKIIEEVWMESLPFRMLVRVVKVRDIKSS